MKYLAEDGTVFKTEAECRYHERHTRLYDKYLEKYLVDGKVYKEIGFPCIFKIKATMPIEAFNQLLNDLELDAKEENYPFDKRGFFNRCTSYFYNSETGYQVLPDWLTRRI